jgi:UPF0148 protein
MPVRKEDEIMAEYLLKGGKMLEKSCKTCGCPLFEVKGKTLCVVCAEHDTAEIPGTAPVAPPVHHHGHECSCSENADESSEGGFLADVLASTILSLCERIQNEKDPDNVLALMNAVKAGTESLQILCQL